MNNIKSYIPIVFLLLILAAGSFGVYKIHTYASTFSDRIVEINNKLLSLEEAKKNIDLYKKILSKGSVEQEQIDSYILSGDSVFKAITNIEKDGKKAGVLGDNLGIVSVTKRENAELKNVNAGEVVVVITAEGETSKVDAYIEALDNLPFVSHLEKINTVFADTKLKTKATITIVITELL